MQRSRELDTPRESIGGKPLIAAWAVCRGNGGEAKAWAAISWSADGLPAVTFVAGSGAWGAWHLQIDLPNEPPAGALPRPL
jgi:hypothetical protein